MDGLSAIILRDIRPQTEVFALLSADAARRFFKKIEADPNGGCWLWSGAASNSGYGSFGFDGRTHLSHRLSYQIHKGEIPSGLEVMHSCDVRLCVNPKHLSVGTHRKNIRDMFFRGRGIVPKSLNQPQVRQAREQLKCGIPPKQVAKNFKVCEDTIYRLRSGKHYKDVV